LEVLSAPEGTDFSFYHVPAAYELALDDLISGRLICHTLEDDAIIPINEWRGYRESGRSAFDSGFWTGEFSFLRHEPPFANKTPVIDRVEAREWIERQHISDVRVGAPPIVGVEVAYRTAYPDGHRASGATWKQAAKTVGGIVGRSVSVTTLMRRLGERKDVAIDRGKTQQ
jgi:hypothetical protein